VLGGEGGSLHLTLPSMNRLNCNILNFVVFDILSGFLFSLFYLKKILSLLMVDRGLEPACTDCKLAWLVNVVCIFPPVCGYSKFAFNLILLILHTSITQ
jgi:hypothetical protein